MGRTTALRVAIGITAWLIFISAVWLTILPYWNHPALELPLTAAILSAYVLMLVRWGLILWLLLRSVRARPLRLVPRSFIAQAAFVAAVHTVMGVLSLIGFLMIWVNTAAGEHAIGVVLHLVLPSGVVMFVGRRSEATPAPAVD
jgi:hypothetical protein